MRLIGVGVGVRLRLTVVVAGSLGGGIVLLLQTSAVARSWDNVCITYTSCLVVALAVLVQGAGIAADGEENGENDGGDLHFVWCLRKDEEVLSWRWRRWLMALKWQLPGSIYASYCNPAACTGEVLEPEMTVSYVGVSFRSQDFRSASLLLKLDTNSSQQYREGIIMAMTVSSHKTSCWASVTPIVAPVDPLWRQRVEPVSQLFETEWWKLSLPRCRNVRGVLWGKGYEMGVGRVPSQAASDWLVSQPEHLTLLTESVSIIQMGFLASSQVCCDGYVPFSGLLLKILASAPVATTFQDSFYNSRILHYNTK